MTKKIIGAMLAVVVLGVALWVWSSSEKAKNATMTPISSDIIFFYGQECSHCQDVEEFITDNNIDEKVNFDSLEVWHNNANAEILTQKARECGLAQEEIGVPLISAKGECFVGTPAVETFLKKEAGIK